MPKADQTIPPETLRSTTKGRPLLGLALVGALLSAAHTHANETQQVVSSNGTTNIVERIDFPVGDIKDIIPAGDKYIIHANPIDSLKDSVAVDALFVMEKDNPNAAFGRTFSDEITSVAYVPSLDFAVWSYKNQINTDLMELRNGQGALKAAGSTTNFVATGLSSKRMTANAQLFASPSNSVYDVSSNTRKIHGFSSQDGEYVQSFFSSGRINSLDKIHTGNTQGVFTLIQESGEGYYNHFNEGVYNITIPETSNTVSMAAIPDTSNTDGHLILGDDTGNAVSRQYTLASIEATPTASIHVFDSPINNMTVTQNSTVKMVSTNNNEVAEVDANLNVLDRLIPDATETGYRKVITDNNDTLLLSNAHSNYFYRVKSR